jgi:hypothetical protein
MKKSFATLSRPLTILFVITTALFIVFGKRMEAKNISQTVVISANLLLYIVTMLNLFFQVRALSNPNPNAVIRGVMAGTFLKLLVIAAAACIYLLVAKQTRSVNAVFVGMALYIIYTWLEVKISLRLNPKK